ncbi:hypothetical protein Syun_012044 [Stephania yunnanensis]|uniref:Uncharacterized protein n=1 Tax=Stephania yunnanensis TaxID=152371 RepID=A0AAP0PH47_9MAGN
MSLSYLICIRKRHLLGISLRYIYILKLIVSSSASIINVRFETSIFDFIVFKNGFPKIREVILKKLSSFMSKT